jgi:hypothetical protein
MILLWPMATVRTLSGGLDELMLRFGSAFWQVELCRQARGSAGLLAALPHKNGWTIRRTPGMPCGWGGAFARPGRVTRPVEGQAAQPVAICGRGPAGVEGCAGQTQVR